MGVSELQSIIFLTLLVEAAKNVLRHSKEVGEGFVCCRSLRGWGCGQEGGRKVQAQLEEDLRPPGVLAQLPLRACAASTRSWPRGAGYSLHPSCEVTL